MVGITLTNSFKTNTITGNLSYRKELLDKALAMIVVPLFNDDDESLELFIQTNGATNKRHMISSTLNKGDAYIALCKNEKRKCQCNSLNCGIHCGVHKLTDAEQFLRDDTKVHTPIQAMVITYIQPTDEVLEPPIEKDQSDISHKYVVFNNKLFQLVDNKADGLCLFYGVISFLKDQNISLGNDSLSVSVRNIRDKETFLESGIVASMLDYLSKLNETDFDELIQYADARHIEVIPEIILLHDRVPHVLGLAEEEAQAPSPGGRHESRPG